MVAASPFDRADTHRQAVLPTTAADVERQARANRPDDTSGNPRFLLEASWRRM